MSLDEDRLADYIVELATSPLQTLLNYSDAQWTDMAARLGPLMDEVERVWQEAGATAAEHIALVMQNNPRETLQQLYERRADIRQVLDTPFVRATDSTHKLIDEAWDAGVEQGRRAGNQDLRFLGLDRSEDGEPSTSILERLHDDAERNGDSVRGRFTDAARSGQFGALTRSLRATSRNQAMRARAGVNVAGTHAWSEAKEAQLAANVPSTARKVWVCSFRNSCATCMKLHGAVRKLDEQFPAHLSFSKAPKVYGRQLNHPPRHPNCRCRIILWLPKVGDTSGMVSAAQAVWREIIAAVRRRRGQG